LVFTLFEETPIQRYHVGLVGKVSQYLRGNSLQTTLAQRLTTISGPNIQAFLWERALHLPKLDRMRFCPVEAHVGLS